MKAVEVRVQNSATQTGLEKNPVIQWRYGEEDAGKCQSSYQIRILNEKGEIGADTGEIYSSRQNNIEIPMELESLHEYAQAYEKFAPWRNSGRNYRNCQYS